MSSLTSTPIDPWAVTLLAYVNRLELLSRRKPTISDYQALLTWAQELNGWIVVVA